MSKYSFCVYALSGWAAMLCPETLPKGWIKANGERFEKQLESGSGSDATEMIHIERGQEEEL